MNGTVGQPDNPITFTVYHRESALWMDELLLGSGVRYKDWSDSDYKGDPHSWHFRVYACGETP